MRPSFSALSKAYPRPKAYDHDALFQMIGWDDLIKNSNYQNTCAIRVSVALADAGMRIPGRMRINKGNRKGWRIEPGQARLSQILAMPGMLGAPERFKGAGAAEKAIGTRSGIISFWRLHPTWINDNQGHIDIVSSGEGGYLRCGGACYFDSAEVWFWPLT